MNRKNLLLLAVIIAGTLAIMAGCTSPQFGAPGTTGAAITGRVATPESCFSDACDNPFITEGKPLPGATALFYGGDSGKLKIEGETECDGAFEVNTTGEGSYVLYVVREYPEGLGKYVVVKKGVNNPRGDVGEANAYTTSQVIIWERANALYGEDFVPFDASWYAQYDWKWSFAPAKLVLPVSEIPNLEPSTQLYNAVEKALSECRDPQEDNRVIHFADQIADATFGAPAGGGAAGGGGAANPIFTVTKSANPTTANVGDEITYTVTVENTGNVSLTGVTISDTLVNSLPNPSGDTDGDGILDTDETWVYTYTYTVQDEDAGKTITNTVTVDTEETDAASGTVDVTVNEVAISGKVCQHNGEGYGQAVAHFRDVEDITKVYSVKAIRSGEFSITLPAGSYVFWADKESGGDKWYTSIGYEPRLSPYWYWYAPYPNGVQCITLNPGDEITNASIWIQNSGGPGVTPRQVPPEGSCL